jgi:hypothetical protein
MTPPAMVPQEDDDAITNLIIGTGEYFYDSSNTFMTQVSGIVMKLEIMLCSHARSLKANRSNFIFYDGISGFNLRIRSFDQLKNAGFRNG